MNKSEVINQQKIFPCAEKKERRTFVTQMIDEASSQPALWLSRQIQRPTANFPPHNRIISPICSGVMCYHLLQHLQIPARLIHEVGQTLLMLLVLCYQLDNRYRCISSKSPGRDHVDHLKLWSSLQGHRHPMNGVNWHTLVHWEITHLYCLPCTRSLIRRHSMSLDEDSENKRRAVKGKTALTASPARITRPDA